MINFIILSFLYELVTIRRPLSGSCIGASTTAQVSVVLVGDLGRTEQLLLTESKTNKMILQRGKVVI